MSKLTGRKGGLSLECIEADAAGIDVGAKEIYVAVPPDRDAEPVRHFQTFTGELRQMAAWLLQCRIRTVAMESTGVYWIPPYEIIEEAGLRVCLVNSRYVRNVPGRKSDVSDCQWLQYLHSVGLLRPSFRPQSAICALRSLSRHRAGLVDSAAVHIQHMHKALTQMNLQIHHVLADITGLSGMAILQAIMDGEHDPVRLAGLCHARVRSDQQTVIASLTGNYRPEHMFTLKQSLAAYQHYQKLLAECDREIEKLIGQMPSSDDPPPPPPPSQQKRRKNQFHFDMRSELVRLMGVDLTEVPGISALTAHVLLSEIGTDLSRFPSAAAFANWLALCPGNKKSGGKILSSKTRPTNSRASHALRLAAQTLARCRSHLGCYYRAMRAPASALPRPLRPLPISWPASSTTSSPPVHPMTRLSSPKNKTNKSCASTNDSASKLSTLASNSFRSPHEPTVFMRRSAATKNPLFMLVVTPRLEQACVSHLCPQVG
jgi:transposase